MKEKIEIRVIVKVETIDKIILASCPDLPEIIAEFESVNEMKEIMPDLIFAAIQARQKYGIALPCSKTFVFKTINTPITCNGFVPISHNQYSGDFCFQA